MVDGMTLVMPAAMDISQVEALHAEIEKLLQQDTNVELDLAAVERIDTAAFQLIFAARKRLQEQGHDLQLSHVPEAVLRAAGTLGFDRILSLQNPAD